MGVAGSNREFSDLAGLGIESAYFIGTKLQEPDRPVSTLYNLVRFAVGRGNVIFLNLSSFWVQTPYTIGSLCEPDHAIFSDGEEMRLAVGIRQFVFGNTIRGQRLSLCGVQLADAVGIQLGEP